MDESDDADSAERPYVYEWCPDIIVSLFPSARQVKKLIYTQ